MSERAGWFRDRWCSLRAGRCCAGAVGMGRARRVRRGGMLVEVILSLAIFVMAGGAIVNLVGQTVAGLERSRERARAADLARSAMAKIEAGIETMQTLNGPVERSAEGAAQAGAGWELEIDSEPSQFRGLTRVTVNAFRRVGERIEVEYRLVQLVRLGGKGEDRAGEEDSIAEKARQGLERAGREPGGGGSGGGAAPSDESTDLGGGR